MAKKEDEVFVFVGWGSGVPLLPHEISRKEAKERGLEELLDQALENGNYEPLKKSSAKKADKTTEEEGK